MMLSDKVTRRAGLAALAIGLTFAAQLVPRRAVAQQPAPVPPPPMGPPPRHPALAEADRSLRRASDALFHAAHDFGGHRVKAIQYIDGALVEIQAARQFAP